MNKRDDFLNGFGLGTPVAISFLPVAVAFGLLAKNAGISSLDTFLMSIFVFAGASQFMAINLLTLGAAMSEIILATFFLNSRHMLMSASLSTKISAAPKRLLAFIGFGITDETYTVASLREGEVSPFLFAGLASIAYLAWIMGTLAGAVMGNIIPDMLQVSMGIALYALFIALLVPKASGSIKVVFISIFAAILNSVFRVSISDGWALVMAALIATLIGTLLFDLKGGSEVSE